MQVMALIYGDASRWDAFSAEEREAVYAKYRAFSNDAREAGVMVGARSSRRHAMRRRFACATARRSLPTARTPK